MERTVIEAVVFISTFSLVLLGIRAAYYNGVTDGYGYSQEPSNPGYARAGQYLCKHMKHRWPSLVNHAVPCLGVLLCCLPMGCVAESPAAVDHRPLSAAVIATTTDEAAPAPVPPPQPGKCDNCNGTGRLGDGTVSVPCPVCGGDGRTDNEPPKTPAIEPVSLRRPDPPKAPTGKPATFLLPPHDAYGASGGNCAGGSCAPVRSQPRRIFGRW